MNYMRQHEPGPVHCTVQLQEFHRWANGCGSVQVRNRDAGRIGHVYLRYDRSCGRYYDVETIEGREICPIEPLFSSKAPAESMHLEPPPEDPDPSVGTPVINMMDHGGFL